MHELAIAEHLVRLVEAQALEAGAERVTQINLRLGEQSHVVETSLTTYFKLLTDAADSSVKGATLVVKRVPMQFVCPPCEFEYPVEANDFTCPRCQCAGRLTDPGDSLLLESLEVVP